MNVVAALDRLNRFGLDLARGVLITNVDTARECADLYWTAAALQGSKPRSPIPVVDALTLEKARLRWNSCRPAINELHYREVRILCWDPDTALDPDFVQALETHEAFPRKRIWIEGLASAYFNHWRTMDNPDRLEKVLRKASCQPCAGKGWLSLCGNHATDIFSKSANVFLAKSARERETPVDAELDRWSLRGHAQLRAATVEAAIGEWLRRYLTNLEGMPDEQAIPALKILFEELLPIAGAASTQFHNAAGKVILSKRAGAAGAVQDAIQTWVLKSDRLGDPRLPRSLPKWNLINPEAARRFKSWLAKLDLRFFFEFVIPDRQDPHGRKPFWLQYIGDNGQVVDSRVVLCDMDRDRLRRATREQFSYGRMADSFDVSAFLMQFRTNHGDIIVVEFSKPGNRIYIHSAVQFEKHLGSLRSPEFRIGSERGLKHTSHLQRFTHHPPGEWQREVKTYLASEHGIRPQ